MQCCPLWVVHSVFQNLLRDAGIWRKKLSQAGDLQWFVVAGDAELRVAVSRLADVMQSADVFYSSLGGILGYQATCLDIIQQNQDRSSGGSSPPDSAGAGIHFHMPQGPDLDGPEGREIAAAEAAKGLEALPHMAEIWPLGGLPPCLAGLNVYKPDVRASRKQGGSVRNNSYTRYALSRWYSNRLESALLQGLHPSPRVISNEEQSLQHTIALLTASLEGGILASPSAL